MTLQAKDLRIGNWVKLNKDWDGEINKAYQINSISFGCPTLETVEFGVGVIGWNDIEPITLTEEWLVWFGFTSDPYNDRYVKGSFRLDINKTRGVLEIWEVNTGIELKLVHKLQNLYYEIEGQEL